MQQATELKKQLQSIHRKSYPAYKSLKGSYQFGHYILSIDVGRILRTFKIKKNVEVTDNGKIII